MMIEYVETEQHYTLLMEQFEKVKRTLWISTADLKDLYVKKSAQTKPLLALIEEKIKAGVAVRLISCQRTG